MKIYPAILTESFLELQQQVDSVRSHPNVDVIHVDVIDGNFADHLTVTPLDLTVGDFEPTQIDFHFMVEEPMDFIFEAVAIKDFLPVRRAYGQIERMSHQADFLEEITRHGWQAGLALDLYTPLDSIDDDIWPQLKHLLLMSVQAGEQAQTFHKQVFDKMTELKNLENKHPQLTVVLDGGVKLTNLKTIAAQGFSEVTAGSALWQSPDPMNVLDEMYRLVGDKE